MTTDGEMLAAVRYFDIEPRCDSSGVSRAIKRLTCA